MKATRLIGKLFNGPAYLFRYDNKKFGELDLTEKLSTNFAQYLFGNMVLLGLGGAAILAYISGVKTSSLENAKILGTSYVLDRVKNYLMDKTFLYIENHFSQKRLCSENIQI